MWTPTTMQRATSEQACVWPASELAVVQTQAALHIVCGAMIADMAPTNLGTALRGKLHHVRSSRDIWSWPFRRVAAGCCLGTLLAVCSSSCTFWLILR